MFARKSAALLLSLAFAAASASAAAVSLGNLTVESRPGEPLNAVLEIDDVDLSVSPLLVRVAPPATYERQGVAWPEEVEGLRIAKDSAKNGVRVRVIGNENVEGNFPLLIELNAGGVVTVREYSINAQNGNYVVSPAAQRTKLTAAVPSVSHPGYALPAATATDAAQRETTAKTTNSVASEKYRQAPQRRGRYAPQVVKEYVALNGFSADEPFKVQRDMTLWSIAKLYWPSYQGTTLEQLASAFTDKNPDAFEKGDASRLIPGATLVPPSLEAVLAVDAEAAFREMHGSAAEIPGPTQNLIQAQRISLDCAESVANAQNALRAKGASVGAVSRAGAKALAACEAPAAAVSTPNESTEMAGTASAAKPENAALTQEEVKEEAKKEAQNQPSQAASASEEGSSAVSSETETSSKASNSASRAPIPIPSEEELRPKIEVSATAVMPTADGAGASETAQPAPAVSTEAAAAVATTPDEAAASAPEGTDAPAADATVENAEQRSASNTPQGAVEPERTTSSDASQSVQTNVSAASNEETGRAEAKATDSKTASADAGGLSMPWIALIAIVAAILGGLAWMRTRKDDAPQGDDEGDNAPKTGSIKFTSVEPATAAQLRAVDATVSEAVKNGTTAGAMGAGAVEYVRAQIEEAKAEAPSHQDASEKTPVTVQAEPTASAAATISDEEAAQSVRATGGAEGAEGAETKPAGAEAVLGAFPQGNYVPPKEQPWLDPNDDELPPLDDESAPPPGASAVDLSAAMAGVTLDLEETGGSRQAAPTEPAISALDAARAEAREVRKAQEAQAAEAASKTSEVESGSEESDFEPITATRYVAPLEPEPMEAPLEKPLATEAVDGTRADESAQETAEAKRAMTTEEKADELEESKFSERRPSEKERAQWSAYDGKLKLANSFIGLGALKEAHELLEEVRRHGSEEQRQQAAFLEERISSRL